MNRDPEENGLLNTCEELGIGFVPWGPMGMGYLTQTLDAQTKFDPKSDLRAEFERFRPESIAANKPFVDRITELAKRKEATTAQLSAGLWTKESGGGSQGERFPSEFEAKGREDTAVFDHFLAQKSEEIQTGRPISGEAPSG